MSLVTPSKATPSQFVRLALILLTSLALAFTATAEPGKDSATKTAADPLKLQSAGQLTFGPDDVLFVADSVGTAVYAIQLKDTDKPSDEELPGIADVDEKVAGLLGTTPRDVLIQDIAVHPTSKNIYLSVSRGRGDDATPVILRVDGKGEFAVVELEGAAHTKAMIANAPAEDAKTRRGRPMRALTITDIAYSDGNLYVAGLSNEEFASNLRQIPYPFTGAMNATSVEIYHGAHGKYETHAPISTLMPYEIEGEAHLLAAYTCTPLVTFPVGKLEDGAHVKGTTIAELGFGNRPLDMISFNKKGEPYILVLNSSRGGMKIAPDDVAKAKALREDVDITRDNPTAGVPYVTLPMGGVLRVDTFDDENLVVLRRDVSSGSLQLRLWKTEWI
ncbi:MAG: hypothetical protein AAF657_09755 [Acidobacteriota bacterium]